MTCVSRRPTYFSTSGGRLFPHGLQTALLLVSIYFLLFVLYLLYLELLSYWEEDWCKSVALLQYLHGHSHKGYTTQCHCDIMGLSLNTGNKLTL